MNRKARTRSRSRSFRLFTAWFDGCYLGQIRRNFVGRKCFHFHPNQGDEGTAEIRRLLAAAIDDHTHGGDDPAVTAHDIDRFPNTSTPRDHVFGNNESLTAGNGEAAAQNEATLVLLHKDVPFPKRSSNLLPDDDAAERRRDHSVACEIPQLVCELSANFGGNVSMLEEKCALKILAAMQTGAQDKMAIEQGPGFAK